MIVHYFFPPPPPPPKVHMLEDALSEFAKFEAELKVKSSHLSNLRVDISNPTTSLAMLKGICFIAPSPTATY